MGLLKKLGRGIKRVAKKNRGGLTRLAKKVGPGLVLSAVTGGIGAPLVAKAASAAKTLGKKVRGLETPKSLVPVFRAATRATKSRGSTTVMPGGLKISTPSVGLMASRAVGAKRSLYKSAKKRKPRAPKATSATAAKKPRVWSAKQIAARERFAAMARARKKAG